MSNWEVTNFLIACNIINPYHVRKYITSLLAMMHSKISFEILSRYTPPPNLVSVKELTDRRTDGKMDRLRDGTENITSTADVGGKNNFRFNAKSNKLWWN